MSDNSKSNLLQEHYTQVQVWISILENKSVDCLSIKTEYYDNRAYTSITVSPEDFAVLTQDKEVVIRPSSISHSILSEINDTCTRMNHITLTCFLEDNDQSITTTMNKGIANAIFEDSNFSFDSKFFTGESNVK